MTIAGAINVAGERPDIARSLRAMALGVSRQRLHGDTGAVLGVCDEAELAVDGPLVALFHGRLDTCDGPAWRSAGLTTAEILLQAYRRWGTDFPTRLIGDFAGAIWDGQAQRLLLFRDALGRQPLHFWQRGNELLFATEPQGLLAQPRVEKQIDERWVARWLALLPHDEPSTRYLGIERVLPGHLAVFDGARMTQSRYWRPEALAPVRLPRDEDYAEAIRSLLKEAIRCRIANAGVVGSHLSAGLDSSSVTALAAQQLREDGRRLIAFTGVPAPDFDGSGYRSRIWDEGPLASRVAQIHPNIDHVLASDGGRSLFDVLDRIDATSGMPAMNPMNHMWIEAIGGEANRRGVNVMLSGGGGNMSFSYDGIGFLTGLARQARWLTLSRHLWALHRRGAAWASLGNRVMAPLLPAPLRRSVRRLFGRPEMDLQQFSALRPAFAEQWGALDEARAMAGDVGNTSLAARDIRLAVLGRVDSAMMLRAQRRRFGFIEVDPTADRRVIEFCLAIPGEQFVLGGEDRSLARRAMRGVLPDEVRLERRRGLQGADWSRHLAAARSEIAEEVERLERSPLGSACLDLPRLRRLLKDWPEDGWHRDGTAIDYRLALMRGLATGRFLRRFEGGNA